MQKHCSLSREDQFITVWFPQTRQDDYLKILQQLIEQDWLSMIEYFERDSKQIGNAIARLFYMIINQFRTYRKKNWQNQAKNLLESLKNCEITFYLTPFFQDHYEKIEVAIAQTQKKMSLRGPAQIMIDEVVDPASRQKIIGQFNRQLINHLTKGGENPTSLPPSEIKKSINFFSENFTSPSQALKKRNISWQRFMLSLFPLEYQKSVLYKNLNEILREKSQLDQETISNILSLILIDTDDNHYGFIDLFANIGSKQTLKIIFNLALGIPAFQGEILEKRLSKIYRLYHGHENVEWLKIMADNYNLATLINLYKIDLGSLSSKNQITPSQLSPRPLSGKPEFLCLNPSYNPNNYVYEISY